MEKVAQTATRRSTWQRQLIYETVCNHPVHPTADYIFHLLKPSYPQLSLGTIYRNLNVLADQGQIHRVITPDTKERYDGRLIPHDHLYCKNCGEVYDIALPTDQFLDQRAAQISGHQVSGHCTIFYGLCKHCDLKG